MLDPEIRLTHSCPPVSDIARKRWIKLAAEQKGKPVKRSVFVHGTGGTLWNMLIISVVTFLPCVSG